MTGMGPLQLQKGDEEHVTREAASCVGNDKR